LIDLLISKMANFSAIVKDDRASKYITHGTHPPDYHPRLPELGLARAALLHHNVDIGQSIMVIKTRQPSSP
jgi:hypothetical protein